MVRIVTHISDQTQYLYQTIKSPCNAHDIKQERIYNKDWKYLYRVIFNRILKKHAVTIETDTALDSHYC
jgi:hypothetical protein